MKKKLGMILLTLVLAVALALPATVVSAADPVYVYGTQRTTGDIWEIDVANQTYNRLVDISTLFPVTPAINPIDGSSPNGNALDIATMRFYFASFRDPGSPPSVSIAVSELYFIDLDTPTSIIYAGQLNGHASDATFYDGKYWYIGHGTDELQQVNLNPDGTIASEVTAATDISTGIDNTTGYLGFGDIAFDLDGMLYVSATLRNSSNAILRFPFGTYDMSASVFTDLGNNSGVQLAFGSDDILYGHSAGSGDFFTIDTTTGVMSSAIPGFSSGMLFGDLASGHEADPSISVDKNTEPAIFEGRASLGDTINYTIDVTNTGNVDLVANDGDPWNDIVDDSLPVSVTYVGGDDGDEKLNPQETWSYTGSYGPLDEDDILNCMLTNTAIVTGYYLGESYTDNDSASVPVSKRVNLWAGKYTDVGDLEIWNDGECLHVIYQIDDGIPWEITEVHLYVGWNEPPANTPGQFPYDIGDADPLTLTETTIKFCIPLADIDSYSMQLNKKGKPTGVMIADGDPGVEPGEPIYIAAHAVVMDVSCYLSAMMYGTEQGPNSSTPGGDIYMIDAIGGTNTFVFSTNLTGAYQNSPNGNAFDPVNNRLYYALYTSETATTSDLWFYDFDTATQTFAGTVAGLVAGAGFYNGEFYYIVNNTDDLMKVTFDGAGLVASTTPVLADFTGNTKSFRFGDLVISQSGMLYISSLQGNSPSTAPEFCSINLNTLTYAFITNNPADAVKMQLAFGSDGKLYGHLTGTGEFYEVNPADGTITGPVSTLNKFTDLASGTLCMPYDETAWGGWGDEFPNIIDFEEPNWSNYIEFFVMDCPEQ